MIIIGRITRPFGMDGEVMVAPMTDFPERFASLGTVFLGEEHTPYELAGQNLRPGNRQVVLQFQVPVTGKAHLILNVVPPSQKPRVEIVLPPGPE